MLKETKIAFIGSGAMASAMLAGLTGKQLVNPTNVIASDPVPAQTQKITEQYGVETTKSNLDAVAGRDVVVLAVKPQFFSNVSAELLDRIPAEALVLSIMAGVTIDNITAKLNHDRVVRVMPNTPAQVGKGMSVWVSTAQVSTDQKQQTRVILSALGEEIAVEQEYYLDMATALSGSAPAYIFLFMEAMIDAGVHMGFSRPVAQQIVYQNVEGAVAFARESQRHPADLRNMVTSPGGTTAAALYALEKGKFRAVISKAIWAAYQKSRHLGGLNTDG